MKDWQPIELLIDQMINDEQKKLLLLARRIVPTITREDILQPNDFPELENHPHFRYEEGLLAGMQTIQMALRALKQG